MSVLEFDNYKKFVVQHFKKMPKAGRGQFRKLAQHLNVSPVIISQVFKGARDLSLEQAFDCCDFLGFGRLERDYFLLLVQKERAGTDRLKKALIEQIKELKQKSDDLKNRIKTGQDLTEQNKARFYSNWYYSGIRLLTDIEGFDHPEEIAEHFNLPLTKVREVLEFLLNHNLVAKQKGKFKVGLQSTHISKDSPLVTNHHRNWRIQAMKKIEAHDDEELFFTGPMVLSHQVFKKIRADLVNLIGAISQEIATSKSERLVCLNIDLMKI